ncbi:elongation factor Ts, mitochondrial-like [Asterias rubens]|uniref:elongation factor Ts, mitochondrial-like n=1 Tax=Asterias rubens TaxID=7604 RepID=UPI0014558F41|nr:elongation factor Ts, mitochondrial-like [Asterias rubens]XP_033629382.1 elongation factor Ts, mitochondrial-like [Asterias rubens]
MFRPGLTVTSLCRLFSTSNIVLSTSKKNLQQLRKKTGFSFANCRKALDKFGNDLKQAEEWLQEQAQKEGWSKATKLKGRTTTQGLIGVMRDGNSATMVEVNCETDFVAKNSEFQGFVGQVAVASLKHFVEQHAEMKDLTSFAKTIYTGEDMQKFALEDQKTLQDITAMTIGKIGENMTLNRSLCLVAPKDHYLGTYIHSVLQSQHKSKCMVGKYGALVAFKKTEGGTKEFRPADIGRRLCQHIVGMSPVTIGEFAEVKPVTPEAPPKIEELKQHESEQDAPPEKEQQVETEMLKQEYLLDPTMTVGDLVRQENLEIIDFARFECGESAVGETSQ